MISKEKILKEIDILHIDNSIKEKYKNFFISHIQNQHNDKNMIIDVWFICKYVILNFSPYCNNTNDFNSIGVSVKFTYIKNNIENSGNLSITIDDIYDFLNKERIDKIKNIINE
jgi:hypothetical protein